MPEKKTVDERLKDLESSVQEFTTKYEHGYAKAENVGAAATATGASIEATGVSAEATAFSASLRLWGYDWDLKAKLEENKLRRQKKHADNLDARIKELKADHEKFVRRIVPIINPINRQFPELKNDVARALTRIDGLRDNLRESRDELREEREAIRRLRHNALQAEPTLESLHRHVRTLATVLGG
ncbi:hypothetical protein ACIP4Y_27555 [Streptomyces sp. NPDC088810]|uniref:hypothetical protein n=1 Tax=Streptomyces sp. NPDC088810 TaxID=3365904 RepID=UPI0038048A33